MATKIQWTQETWNPTTGCSKLSEACQNCYAETMARRLQKMPGSKEKYKNGFLPTEHPDSLGEPYKWKTPRMVFVTSMGDLFHEAISDRFLERVLMVIQDNPQHTFQLLTKRSERMASFFSKFTPPENAWLGVTCESAGHYDRIDHLRTIKKAAVRFLSCEPLLGNMPDINLDRIDWVITGGESGTRARHTDPHWFRSLRDATIAAHKAFFFKQWGAWGEDGVKRGKEANGALLDGEEWKMMPGDKDFW